LDIKSIRLNFIINFLGLFFFIIAFCFLWFFHGLLLLRISFFRRFFWHTFLSFFFVLIFIRLNSGFTCAEIHLKIVLFYFLILFFWLKFNQAFLLFLKNLRAFFNMIFNILNMSCRPFEHFLQFLLGHSFLNFNQIL